MTDFDPLQMILWKLESSDGYRLDVEALLAPPELGQHTCPLRPAPIFAVSFAQSRFRQSRAYDQPHGVWAIEHRLTGYHLNKAFNGPRSEDVGPCWSFSRYGRTETMLPDGRLVRIGGEYEDQYDADFYIYNDVIVSHPGGGPEIFGYSDDVFPPTDFHTANLVDDRIFMVGSLSYPSMRGQKGASARFGHNNLCHRNHLFWLRRRLSDRASGRPEDSDGFRARHLSHLGPNPRIDLLETLYTLDVPHSKRPEVPDEHRVYRLRVEGVTVRYVEGWHDVRLTVEGVLPDRTVEMIRLDLLTKLTTIENTAINCIQVMVE